MKLFVSQAPTIYGNNSPSLGDPLKATLSLEICATQSGRLDCHLKIMFSSGVKFQTFNVHQLLHLPEVVRDLGPLWSNSCFPFEDYNGDLRDLFHETRNVDGQVCFWI